MTGRSKLSTEDRLIICNTCSHERTYKGIFLFEAFRAVKNRNVICILPQRGYQCFGELNTSIIRVLKMGTDSFFTDVGNHLQDCMAS
jgi:hypothetical protein